MTDAVKGLEAELKLLRWHKLANESALKAAILKDKRTRRDDASSPRLLTNDSKARLAAAIEDERSKDLIVRESERVAAFGIWRARSPPRPPPSARADRRGVRRTAEGARARDRGGREEADGAPDEEAARRPGRGRGPPGGARAGAGVRQDRRRRRPRAGGSRRGRGR